MKIRVYWDFPDYAVNSDDCYEDIDEPNDANESQIETDAKETAFEHFDWSYEKIRTHILRVYFEYPDFATQKEDDFEDIEITGKENDDELESIARGTISDHFEWSYDVLDD